MSKGKHSERGIALLNDLKERAGFCLVNSLPSNIVDDAMAKQIGAEIMRLIYQHWGGQTIYVPMGLKFLADERDALIYADFTGSNHHELAAKYHLSVNYVYAIIRRMREEERANRQPCLF